MAKIKSEKKIIGRIEKVNLPDWNLLDLDAKIDTGAHTSSLHCHHIEEFEKNGNAWVRFNLLDPEHPAYNEHLFEYPIFDARTIKSSNGFAERRIIVKTKLEFASRTYTVELSLADRSEMRYPVLLGRKFLRKRFLVDVTLKYSFKN